MLLQLGVAVAVGGAGHPAAGGASRALEHGRVRQVRCARQHLHRCNRRQRIPAEQAAAKGRGPPAMAARMAPTAAVTRPLHVKFGCNGCNRQPLEGLDGGKWPLDMWARCLLWLLAWCAGSSSSGQCAASMYLDNMIKNRIFTVHFDPQERRIAASTASAPNRVRRPRRSSLLVLALTRVRARVLDVCGSASSATQARLHRTSQLVRRRDIFTTAAKLCEKLRTVAGATPGRSQVRRRLTFAR